MLALDWSTLAWSEPADIRFMRGALADVDVYGVLAVGDLQAADALDLEADTPAPANGFYYLVRPLGCGSWQTEPESRTGSRRITALITLSALSAHRDRPCGCGREPVRNRA